MKRALTWILVLSLLVLCIPALAEAPAWEGGVAIGSEPVALDLDGDGNAESIYVETVPDEFESFQRLHVSHAGGAECTFDAEVIDSASAWAADLNGDGLVEIFLWGDVMSDDYCTWCLHDAGDHLAPVLFADLSRGGNDRGYYKSGYGMLVDADLEAGTITLCGSQDALGTYFMDRTLALSADGLFETADEGLWVRRIDDVDWDEDWGVLTAKASIACEIDGQSASIQPGEKLLITATDKDSVAMFVTQDGRHGVLSIGEDYERGWGLLVDGVPEEDVFEYIPYAD